MTDDLKSEQMVDASIMTRKQDQEIDELARQRETDAESDVKGSCFSLVDTCAERFAPHLLPQLYRPFGRYDTNGKWISWPGYTADWETNRAKLINLRNVAPHLLWNEFCRRYEEEVKQDPLAMYEAGRSVQTLNKWGLTDKMVHAAARMADVKVGWLGVPAGNKAWNNNKAWQVDGFRREGSRHFARLSVQIKNKELGLDHNIDVWSLLFWIGIASSVPCIWAQPHAKWSFLESQFDIEPYLLHFASRCRFHNLETRIGQIAITGDQLMIDGQVYGLVTGTNSRNRPIVRITRQLYFTGGVDILSPGQIFGAEKFVIDFEYKPLGIVTVYKRKFAIVSRVTSRLFGEDHRHHLHVTGDEHLEYELARRELEIDDDYLLSQRQAQQDEARRLKSMSAENKLKAAQRIAEQYEVYDGHTREHIYRVPARAEQIARIVGLSEEEIEFLKRGCFLHDLGKSRVPLHILGYPGKLPPDFLVIMRKHAVYGDEMAREAEFDERICQIIRWHHETLDGKGYPDGLKGSKIPLLVQIAQICDIFDALTNARQYKEPWTLEETFDWMDRELAKKDKMDQVLFDQAVRAFAQPILIG